MAINILVTGDLHLGKRSTSVTAGDTRLSTRYTWEKIVQYAITNETDILLLTGDIVDRDNRFYEAIGPLQTGFNRLSQAGICVYMVAGNHDYDVLPQIIQLNNYPGIHLLGSNGHWQSSIFTKANGESIRLTGWSFTEKYIHNSAIDKGFPESDDNIPTLAIVHGDAYQSVSKYNPVNSEKLKHIRQVDAWLLGHIHKPDIICRQSPFILYPGSPHALNPGEKGIHGIWSLSIENREIDYRHIPFSPVCYHTLKVDVSKAIDNAELRKLIITAINNHLTEVRQSYMPSFMVYDIELTGTNNRIYELKKWAQEIKTYNIEDWCNVSIRNIEFNILPQLDIHQLINEPSYIGVLANAITVLESGSTNPFVDKLIADWINRYEQMVSLPVYLPLKAGKPEDELTSIAREYVLKECRELIVELNLQRHDN